jgi:integrase
MAKAKSDVKGVTSRAVNGEVYWYARIPQKKYFGKGDEGRGLAEAARANFIRSKYEADRAQREMGAGLKVQVSEFNTVRQMIRWYMEELPEVQKEKAYGRKAAAAPHLLKHLGAKGVAAIKPDVLSRYRERRLKEGVMDGTVDLEIRLLSAIYYTALENDKITREMIPKKFPLVNEVNPHRLVTDEEYQKLLEASDQDLADVFVCAYESAMRRSEIEKLTASQVILGEERVSGGKRIIADYINLGIFDTKTKARRTVPISPVLKNVLERRLKGLDPADPDALVFTTRYGRPHTKFSMGHTMKGACEAAGITYGDRVFNEKGERIGITFHCFRHTRITRWIELGFSDEIVRRASGHKSLDSYRRYAKPDPGAVMRLVANGLEYAETDKTGTTEERISLNTGV